MPIVDLFIIILFIVAALYGFRKGIIVQLGAVGGIIGGIILCRLIGGSVTRAIAPADAQPNELYIYGVFVYILVFVVGYIAIRLLARLIKTVTSTLHISIIDRIGGAIFSVFQWFLFASFILNIWQAFSPSVDVVSYSKLAGGRPAKAILDLAPMVLGAETSQAIFGTVEKVGQIKRITDQFNDENEE